jgi:hypothetical protein
LDIIEANIKIIREHGDDCMFQYMKKGSSSSSSNRTPLRRVINFELLKKYRNQVNHEACKVPWKAIWNKDYKRIYVTGWPSSVPVGKDISDLLKRDLSKSKQFIYLCRR